jgi:hypothetical protein
MQYLENSGNKFAKVTRCVNHSTETVPMKSMETAKGDEEKGKVSGVLPTDNDRDRF